MCVYVCVCVCVILHMCAYMCVCTCVSLCLCVGPALSLVYSVASVEAVVRWFRVGAPSNHSHTRSHAAPH